MIKKSQKIRFARPLCAQIVFTAFAFAVMVVLSYMFASGMVQRYLVDRATGTIETQQTKVESFFDKSDAILGIVQNSIYSKILKGYNQEGLRDYVMTISEYLINGTDHMEGTGGIYGPLTTLDGDSFYVSGSGWIPPPEYVPQERPWYTAAVEAGGRTAESQPYLDMRTGGYVWSYSRAIISDDGKIFGVISIDVPVSIVAEEVINSALAQGGYGFLVANDMTVLSHPHEPHIGRNVLELLPDTFADDMLNGRQIFERPMASYLNEDSLAFFQPLSNGWYLGFVAPRKLFYTDVTLMALILTIMGAILAMVLMFVLIRIDRSKEKSDMESRRKSTFLANMSHEIRTPMNAILGITEIQLQKGNLDSEMKEALGKVCASGYILLGIINDILDLSKIEAGKLELVTADYEIASMISDTVQLNIMRIGGKQISFELSIDENIPTIVTGDELRVKQILNNLLSNAFKYTIEGTVKLSILLEEKSTFDTDKITLVFIVADTGQGMTEEQVGKLFDEYSQFNQEANRTTEGTGLGMNITRNLLRMMGGSISVESKEGKGSVFTARVPQIKATSAVLGKKMVENLLKFRSVDSAEMKRIQITREPMPYGKVLVVDDVSINIDVAKQLLESYQLQVDTAQSGFETIDIIKSGKVYDIIFMDHMMPKMDGMETTKKLRELGCNQTIIALTANAIAGQQEIFLSNGFDGFISKPIDMRQLNEALNRFVRDKNRG